MFPLDVSNVENFSLITGAQNDSELWHLRYKHLNFKGPQLLDQKGIVHGLPKLKSFDICEGCIYGKQV